MKSRKEIEKMLKDLDESYTNNRGMLLYKTTELKSFVVETEDDYKRVKR